MTAFRPSAEDITTTFNELRRCTASPNEWFGSPVGADLSVDGYDALRMTSPKIFDAYLTALLKIADSESALRGDPGRSFTDWLELTGHFVRACAEDSGSSPWHALAVSLAAVKSMDSSLSLLNGACIVNDSALLILSKTYRSFRVAGFNSGVVARFVDSVLPPFHPESGVVQIAQPYQIDLDPPRVQNYNVMHDVAHIALFGDCYIRPIGSRADTAALLLNAEETCCALDLRVMNELVQYRVDLHHLTEISRTQSAPLLKGQTGVMLKLATEDAVRILYEEALRRSATGMLRHGSILNQPTAPVPCDLDQWISPSALGAHAKWCEEQAVRIHRPAYQSIVSLVPPAPESHTILIHAATGQLDVLAEPTGRSGHISLSDRRENIRRNLLRFLAAWCAEQACACEAQGETDSVERLRSVVWSLVTQYWSFPDADVGLTELTGALHHHLSDWPSPLVPDLHKLLSSDVYIALTENSV